MTKYEIGDYTEETECCECGQPLYKGDTAFMSDDEQNVFCSLECGEDHQQ